MTVWPSPPLVSLVDAARARRSAQLVVANLRILLGFGFLPAGLKKVLGERFTAADKVGVFHEFLHAFWAVEPLYLGVGALQLAAAAFLMTQRFALVGALMMFPILVAINLLCWSSAGVPTIVTVTLMLGATLLLIAWDVRAWWSVFSPHRPPPMPVATTSLIHPRIWSLAGMGVFLIYFVSCALHGGVYRPKGVDLHHPAFYVLPVVMLVPPIAYVVDRRWWRASQRTRRQSRAEPS